jgi:hypothetical protein
MLVDWGFFALIERPTSTRKTLRRSVRRSDSLLILSVNLTIVDGYMLHWLTMLFILKQAILESLVSASEVLCLTFFFNVMDLTNIRWNILYLHVLIERRIESYLEQT